MELTQTCKLSEEEQKALEIAFGVIDHLADITHTSMDNVFDVLLEDYADIVADYKYSVRRDIQLQDF